MVDTVKCNRLFIVATAYKHCICFRCDPTLTHDRSRFYILIFRSLVFSHRTDFSFKKRRCTQFKKISTYFEQIYSKIKHHNGIKPDQKTGIAAAADEEFTEVSLGGARVLDGQTVVDDPDPGPVFEVGDRWR